MRSLPFSGSCNQDSRRPAPSTVEEGPTYGVDPARDSVEPPVRNPVLDRPGAEAQCQQLGPRQDPMLPRSQSPGFS